MKNGKKITCPHCKKQATIYHGKFTALMCGRMQDGAVVEGCGKMVDKADWLEGTKASKPETC